MALNNFISSVWAASLLTNLHKSLVYGQEGVVNKSYEGDIREQGNIVKINNIGAITVFDYAKNTDLPAPETLTDGQRELLIDRAKGFNFQVDDIDAAQARPSVMDEAMREAAYALRDEQDKFIASLYTGVAAANTIGSTAVPEIPTTETAYNYLVDLAVKLDEANVPLERRWCVVPPWFHGLLLKDERFVKAGTSRSDEALRNGEVGEAAGFRILKSNNVPNTTGSKYKIIAGHPSAVAVAEQIVSVEAYRMEKRFADAIKGLHLYGAKLVRPTAIAVLTADKAQ
jgi:hypothetical protein